MKMGDLIKLLRLSRGLTQEELGEIVGVNAAAVNKWEKGTVENIKRTTIKKLADYFAITPCELMCWDEGEANKIPAAKNEVKLIEDYRKLNEEGQNRVDEYVEDLIASGRYKKISDAENSQMDVG